MPIKKSAMKALRQSDKRAERNRNIKETIAYLRRMHRKMLEAGEATKAEELLKDIVKKVDRAAQKKVLKKNTAARIKSRLSKKKAADKKAEEKPAKKTASKKTSKKK